MFDKCAVRCGVMDGWHGLLVAHVSLFELSLNPFNPLHLLRITPSITQSQNLLNPLNLLRISPFRIYSASNRNKIAILECQHGQKVE